MKRTPKPQTRAQLEERIEGLCARLDMTDEVMQQWQILLRIAEQIVKADDEIARAREDRKEALRKWRSLAPHALQGLK